MDNLRPHLLTLPREIRDKIYRYLHHETHLTRPCNIPLFSDPAILTVYNTPHPSVLMSHSRLRDEYLEAECFKHPRFAVHLDLLPNFDSDDDRLEASEFLKRISARSQTITVFIDAVPKSLTSPTQTCWITIRRLVQAFVAKAPKLSTVRITMCVSKSGSRMYSLPEIKEDLNASSRGRFILPPPDNLSSLAVVQRGEGYRIDHWVGLPARYMAPRKYADRGLLYWMEMFGAYVFTREVNSKEFWRLSELEEKWSKQEYSKIDLENLRREGEEEVAFEPTKIKEWKEMRENELKGWQDGDAENMY